MCEDTVHSCHPITVPPLLLSDPVVQQTVRTRHCIDCMQDGDNSCALELLCPSLFCSVVVVVLCSCCCYFVSCCSVVCVCVCACVCACVRACVCVCVRARACVCVCSAFLCVFFSSVFLLLIILYVNCFGRTMLYMCIEYHT